MPEQTERERLIEELMDESIIDEGEQLACPTKNEAGVIADFILADRRRILEEVEKPLKEIGRGAYSPDRLEHAQNTIQNDVEIRDLLLAKIAELKGEV